MSFGECWPESRLLSLPLPADPADEQLSGCSSALLREVDREPEVVVASTRPKVDVELERPADAEAIKEELLLLLDLSVPPAIKFVLAFLIFLTKIPPSPVVLKLFTYEYCTLIMDVGKITFWELYFPFSCTVP